MTAWIDGSLIYSTSEAWLNAMRSFQNGTLLTDRSGKMPVKNTMRVPLFNNPVPHVMRALSPERLYRESDRLTLLRNWKLNRAISLQFSATLGRIRIQPFSRSQFSSSAGITSWRIAWNKPIRHGAMKRFSNALDGLSSPPFKTSLPTSICQRFSAAWNSSPTAATNKTYIRAFRTCFKLPPFVSVTRWSRRD